MMDPAVDSASREGADGDKTDPRSSTLEPKQVSRAQEKLTADTLSQHPCSSCDDSFSRKVDLQRHTQEVHSKSTTKFHCDYCGYAFPRLDKLRYHMEKHHDIKPAAQVQTTSGTDEVLSGRPRAREIMAGSRPPVVIDIKNAWSGEKTIHESRYESEDRASTASNKTAALEESSLQSDITKQSSGETSVVSTYVSQRNPVSPVLHRADSTSGSVIPRDTTPRPPRSETSKYVYSWPGSERISVPPSLMTVHTLRIEDLPAGFSGQDLLALLSSSRGFRGLWRAGESAYFAEYDEKANADKALNELETYDIANNDEPYRTLNITPSEILRGDLGIAVTSTNPKGRLPALNARARLRHLYRESWWSELSPQPPERKQSNISIPPPVEHPTDPSDAATVTSTLAILKHENMDERPLGLQTCDRCRKRRFKCNGLQPCVTCLRGGVDCIFSAEAETATRSETQLNEDGNDFKSDSGYKTGTTLRDPDNSSVDSDLKDVQLDLGSDRNRDRDREHAFEDERISTKRAALGGLAGNAATSAFGLSKLQQNEKDVPREHSPPRRSRSRRRSSLDIIVHDAPPAVRSRSRDRERGRSRSRSSGPVAAAAGLASVALAGPLQIDKARKASSYPTSTDELRLGEKERSRGSATSVDVARSRNSGVLNSYSHWSSGLSPFESDRQDKISASEATSRYPGQNERNRNTSRPSPQIDLQDYPYSRGEHTTSVIPLPSTRQRRKVACQRCRNHKIKCDNQQPCKSCGIAKVECIYLTRDRMLKVQERYMRELEDRAKRVGVSSTSPGIKEHHEKEGSRSSFSGKMPHTSDRKVMVSEQYVRELEDRITALDTNKKMELPAEKEVVVVHSGHTEQLVVPTLELPPPTLAETDAYTLKSPPLWPGHPISDSSMLSQEERLQLSNDLGVADNDWNSHSSQDKQLEDLSLDTNKFDPPPKSHGPLRDGHMESVNRIHDQSTKDLRNLRRRKASALDVAAITANKVAASQAKAIFVFTLVTVIFLPLSFLTSFYGMNVEMVRGKRRDQSSVSGLPNYVLGSAIIVALLYGIIVVGMRSVRRYQLDLYSTISSEIEQDIKRVYGVEADRTRKVGIAVPDSATTPTLTIGHSGDLDSIDTPRPSPIDGGLEELNYVVPARFGASCNVQPYINQCLRVIADSVLKSLRPSCHPDLSRLEWTCTCGKAMYGDYNMQHSTASGFTSALPDCHVNVEKGNFGTYLAKRIPMVVALSTYLVVAILDSFIVSIARARDDSFYSIVANLVVLGPIAYIGKPALTSTLFSRTSTDSGLAREENATMNAFIHQLRQFWFSLTVLMLLGVALPRVSGITPPSTYALVATNVAVLGVCAAASGSLVPLSMLNSAGADSNQPQTTSGGSSTTGGQTSDSSGGNNDVTGNSISKNIRGDPKNHTNVANGQVQQTQPVSQTSQAMYFELCVNRNNQQVSLCEIQMTDVQGRKTITTDKELFAQIRKRYDNHRRRSLRRLLYQPQDIHFVQFGVLRAGVQTGIYDQPLAIPPALEVAEKRYHYFECPLKPLPPMDRRTFFHYFWEHDVHPPSGGNTVFESLFMSRLPKKLGDSIFMQKEPKLQLGWGVHIIEGPNKPLLAWLATVIMVISFVVSLAYDIGIKNQDSGFAIGQWMVAVLGTMLMALYFHLADVA